MSNRGRHRKSSKNKKLAFNTLSISVYNEIKKCVEQYYFSNNSNTMSWRIEEDIKKKN